MLDQIRTFTMIRRMKGCLAPKWHENTPITIEENVYNYEIVLLELICYKRNIETNVSEPKQALLSN